MGVPLQKERGEKKKMHACTSPPHLLIDPLSVIFIADVTALAEIQYFGAQPSAMWRLKAAATARQVAAAASEYAC